MGPHKGVVNAWFKFIYLKIPMGESYSEYSCPAGLGLENAQAYLACHLNYP